MSFHRFAFSLLFSTLTCGAWAAVAGGSAPVYPVMPAAPRSIYQKYAPVPTKSPTPAPDVARITLHGNSFSIAAQGSLAIPFGDYGTQYKNGGGGGLELIYSSSSDMGFSVFAEYNSVPYSLTETSQPFTSFGLGVRVLYEFFNFEGMKPFVEGGMGAYFINRASSSGPARSAGLGFSGGLGAIYSFLPNFGVRAVINVTSIGLDGGTGENILYAGPSFGIIYTF